MAVSLCLREVGYMLQEQHRHIAGPYNSLMHNSLPAEWRHKYRPPQTLHVSDKGKGSAARGMFPLDVPGGPLNTLSRDSPGNLAGCGSPLALSSDALFVLFFLFLLFSFSSFPFLLGYFFFNYYFFFHFIFSVSFCFSFPLSFSHFLFLFLFPSPLLLFRSITN